MVEDLEVHLGKGEKIEGCEPDICLQQIEFIEAPFTGPSLCAGSWHFFKLITEKEVFQGPGLVGDEVPGTALSCLGKDLGSLPCTLHSRTIDLLGPQVGLSPGHACAYRLGLSWAGG